MKLMFLLFLAYKRQINIKMKYAIKKIYASRTRYYKEDYTNKIKFKSQDVKNIERYKQNQV